MKQVYCLLMMVLVISCYKESDYHQPFDESLFTIVATSPAILADSFSTTKISMSIPGNADDSNYSSITVTTNAGSFVEGNGKTITVKAKLNIAGTLKTADVYLKSGNAVKKAMISIELFEHRKSLEIDFQNAFPETIKLSSSSLAIQPTNSSIGEVIVNGLIRRNNGFPSINNLVDIKAYDSTKQKPLGSFRLYNNRSDESGKTNYVFVLGDSLANGSYYTGKLFLIGRATNAQNTEISDTIQLISSK